jgi:hypothetical protein
MALSNSATDLADQFRGWAIIKESVGAIRSYELDPELAELGEFVPLSPPRPRARPVAAIGTSPSGTAVASR